MLQTNQSRTGIYSDSYPALDKRIKRLQYVLFAIKIGRLVIDILVTSAFFPLAILANLFIYFFSTLYTYCQAKRKDFVNTRLNRKMVVSLLATVIITLTACLSLLAWAKVIALPIMLIPIIIASVLTCRAFNNFFEVYQALAGALKQQRFKAVESAIGFVRLGLIVAATIGVTVLGISNLACLGAIGTVIGLSQLLGKGAFSLWVQKGAVIEQAEKTTANEEEALPGGATAHRCSEQILAASDSVPPQLSSIFLTPIAFFPATVLNTSARGLTEEKSAVIELMIFRSPTAK